LASEGVEEEKKEESEERMKESHIVYRMVLRTNVQGERGERA
jgi:uncharacterized hydantoinase/oxoprolinase family protein